MLKLLCIATLLFALHLKSTHGLRFSHIPVTVDSEVVLINKPARLKCHYVKFRTENVREIRWFAAYEGFRSKIFEYKVTTGSKENSQYSFVKTDDATATETELTIVLPEYRGNPVTIGCEVEVLRDNGYGKLAHSKKLGEVNVTVVDTTSHQLLLKNGNWNGGSSASSYTRRNPANFEATVGQPLVVSCISRNANPAPNLTVTLNGQPWEQTSATSKITTPLGVTRGTKVIEARMDTVYDTMFNADGVMALECVAKYQNYLFDKKQLGLTKRQTRSTSTTSVWDSRQRGPSGSGYQAPATQGYHSGGFTQPRQGRYQGGHVTDGGADHNLIHKRLLDLMDPARHMHPGIPYDFYSGYILMVADNVDDTSNNVNTGSSSSGYSSYRSSTATRRTTPTTHLFGKLPDDVNAALQRNYGRVQKISAEKMKIEMDPVDVLNLLGTHGYRVIGFTAEADKKMVWTLEHRDFESKILGQPHAHG